jgi:rhodanese-related sulfurtransferase
MAEMLDCLVNYFSGDTNDDGMPRLYVCYRVISGPGTTAAGALASISVLAANHSGIWESCERFHAVTEGGPAAALTKTLRYLDAFHDDNYMRKVQTETRSVPCQDQWFGQTESSEHVRGTVAAPRVEPMVLLAQMESGESMAVLDARSNDTWAASTLRIRGDVRIDRDHLQVDPSWSKDELIVVYCTSPHDADAAEVAGWLREQGFARAYVLNGGLDAWQGASGPVEAK